MYIFGITKQNLLKLNAFQQTKIKQNQLSCDNMYITLRHSLSHLHIKQI